MDNKDKDLAKFAGASLLGGCLLIVFSIPIAIIFALVVGGAINLPWWIITLAICLAIMLMPDRKKA